MTASTMSTQPPPIAAALPPGPGPGASTAKLGARSIPPAPHPDPAADQPSVIGIGAAGGDDRPIASFPLAFSTGAGLAGVGGRHHRGGGSVAPEPQIPGHSLIPFGDQRRGAAALGVVPLTASR